MNRAELRDYLAFIVGFNTGQADQGGFAGPSTDPNKRLHQALNLGYRHEVLLAKQNGDPSFFHRRFEFTWTADAATLTIPAQVKGKQIDYLRNDTSVSPGPVIHVNAYRNLVSGFYLVDKDTWGWYPAPSSDQTLVAVYAAEAEELLNDVAIPDLIPNEHHELICWGAAVLLRTVGDEAAPQQWLATLQEHRYLFWKQLALGRPASHPPAAIMMNDPDVQEYF